MTHPVSDDGMNTRSFKEAYGVLQQHAETLREQEEPNIDDLLTIVTESVEAYKVCKERIDAVDAALKAALDDAGVGASMTPGGSTAVKAKRRETPNSAPTRPADSTVPPLGASADEDDVPF